MRMLELGRSHVSRTSHGRWSHELYTCFPRSSGKRVPQTPHVKCWSATDGELQTDRKKQQQHIIATH